jgi:hypothetical protein
MKRSPLLQDPAVVVGILATIIVGFVLGTMDSLAKWLMQALPTQQVLWARYFFHTLIVGLVFTLQSGRYKKNKHTPLPIKAENWRQVRPEIPSMVSRTFDVCHWVQIPHETGSGLLLAWAPAPPA